MELPVTGVAGEVPMNTENKKMNSTPLQEIAVFSAALMLGARLTTARICIIWRANRMASC